MTSDSLVFALPDALAAKAESGQISADESHFAAIAASLEASVEDVARQLDARRKAPGGWGQAALERDLEIHRLSARLRALQRYGLDLCLGRMVRASDGEAVYVGRLGLTDGDGRRLLVDWRSPAAEPFFGATHANPMGLSSRRRYRWTLGRITDYWDEVFSAEDLGSSAALDDQSAFIASLGSSRSPRMRDVLGTIQADQDAIIRASSRGALVVDGGPGTGKTVVALHRTAYLLYSDPRLGHRRGGVLFVGPHPAYLAYVSDVLPSLGEEGVQTCTIRDLVPEGALAASEEGGVASRLKADRRMAEAVEAAVRWCERPPGEDVTVETPWADVTLDPDDWAEAFDAVEPGTPHNEAREQVWDQLVAILADRLEGVPERLVAAAAAGSDELRSAFDRAWPIVDPVELVAELWSTPSLLGRCAPWLSPEEVEALQREHPRRWTLADLPVLDAARHRIGDPGAERRKRQHAAAVAAEREQIDRVVDDLLAADDGEGLVTMFRVGDLQDSLLEVSAQASADPDSLTGPFAHIVVDEAQELSDAEWQMLLRRCPSRSFTIVGDRAQARAGFSESWRERLDRVGFGEVAIASLSINYRTPAEVMRAAEPVIREALPDANVPTSVRSTGVPVAYGPASDLDAVLTAWLAEHESGIACVIGARDVEESPRVRSLTPALAKGLEFDLVVLVDPECFGDGIQGAVDRYVAMTRATQRLVVLTSTAGAPCQGLPVGATQ